MSMCDMPMTYKQQYGAMASPESEVDCHEEARRLVAYHKARALSGFRDPWDTTAPTSCLNFNLEHRDSMELNRAKPPSSSTTTSLRHRDSMELIRANPPARSSGSKSSGGRGLHPMRAVRNFYRRLKGVLEGRLYEEEDDGEELPGYVLRNTNFITMPGEQIWC